MFTGEKLTRKYVADKTILYTPSGYVCISILLSFPTLFHHQDNLWRFVFRGIILIFSSNPGKLASSICVHLTFTVY
jgi:hypothetical protein